MFVSCIVCVHVRVYMCSYRETSYTSDQTVSTFKSVIKLCSCSGIYKYMHLDGCGGMLRVWGHAPHRKIRDIKSFEVASSAVFSNGYQSIMKTNLVCTFAI